MSRRTEADKTPPHWMSRVEVLVRIIVQLYLGLLILILPWLAFWTENNLWTYSPFLGALAVSGFFRGAISGLGLLNIFFALQGARKPA